MRVARFYAPGDIRLEDADEPSPGPNEVKIRVRQCSTCGTDVKISKHGHHHLVPPRVIGHEIAGEVVEAGANVSGWTAGDRVQVIAAMPCGTCADCRGAGRPSVPTRPPSATTTTAGSRSSWWCREAVLAVDGLNRIPDGVSFAEASVAEPLACVVNGQELAGVGQGDDVVVVGAGPIGCLHVRLARANGARRVFLVELNRSRLDMAAAAVEPDAAICSAEVDAVDEVRKLTDGRGADVVITAAASGAAQEEALQMAARSGRISFFGGLPKDKPTITLDSNLVHYRELTIVGANGSSPAHNKRALELIASGQVPVARPDHPPAAAVDGCTTRSSWWRAARAIKVTIEP